MKLRNKKTGEVANFQYLQNDYIAPLVLTVVQDDGKPKMYKYNSFAELYAEWEDYTPKEPLIKDEKMRKAVRAWAEACRVSESEELRVCQGHGCSFIQLGASDAQFSLLGVDYGIPYDDYCTIAELCGEEQ